jgi:hypothetical protein
MRKIFLSLGGALPLAVAAASSGFGYGLFGFWHFAWRAVPLYGIPL